MCLKTARKTHSIALYCRASCSSNVLLFIYRGVLMPSLCDKQQKLGCIYARNVLSKQLQVI